MGPVVVLLHVGESLGAAYAAPLGAAWRNFVLGSGSGAYDENTGLVSRYPTLQGFLQALVPEWEPGSQLVLVAWSAGCWAPRAWMKDPAQRELVSALVLLDGLHSGFAPGGGCKEDAVDGIVGYGQLAASRPGQHLLVLTHTEIDPPGYASTTQCAELVEEELPSSVSILIQGYPGDDAKAHTKQVREVGPAIMRDVVAGHLAGTRDTGMSPLKALALVALIFGLASAAVILSR